MRLVRRASLLAAICTGGAGTLAAAGWGQVPAAPEGPDEARAIWAPAAPQNYDVSDRPRNHPIDMVVIHDIEGTAASTVQWFQNPRAHVSAHYVVGPGGQQIWQQVRERDIAWHVGNYKINTRAIGIEHEGYAYRPGFFDRGLYESSAALVRDITLRYGIPRDRKHIIGHFEVPHPTDPTKFGGASGHTDPGPYWDWDYYMALVRSEARLEAIAAPAVLHPGEKANVSVTMTNWGDDPWPILPRGEAPATSPPVLLEARPDEPISALAPSPLYDAASWTSPRFACSADGKSGIAPGTAAKFSFSILGPRALGSVSEPLRMAWAPAAPHRPVPFGPEVPLSVRVEPWDLTLGPEAPAFRAPGWDAETLFGVPVSTHRFRKKDPDVQPARWTAALPISGTWDVLAEWSGGRNRSKAAVYEITTAAGPQRVTVDQRHRTEDWRSLGRFHFTGAKPTVTITLTADRDGVVEAAPIHLMGPFPDAPTVSNSTDKSPSRQEGTASH